uniref:TACI cysteine-rich domain-containing protein n=1 Tax=Sphenodon punctatus TaxID=8508 RepID=A0A8D0G845_SPHPU
MECNRHEGFYYDDLLRNCNDCSTICGQHPWQCVSFCESKLATTSPTAATLVQKPGRDQDQWLVFYMLLGLCFCMLICSLLLAWTHFKKKGREASCHPNAVPCHKREDSTKDCLVEAGSIGRGSTGSQTPKPVETCGFCFPETRTAMQETAAGHSNVGHLRPSEATAHAGISSTGCAGATPTSEEGHFQIICSPSQEKTPAM